jgi:hypothetical protein
MLNEPHYTPKELGEKLRVSATTIIRWIKDDPDVLRQHNPGTQRKRQYNTYSIPQHVAQRIYSEHLRKNQRVLLLGADRRKVTVQTAPVLSISGLYNPLALRVRGVAVFRIRRHHVHDYTRGHSGLHRLDGVEGES